MSSFYPTKNNASLHLNNFGILEQISYDHLFNQKGFYMSVYSDTSSEALDYDLLSDELAPLKLNMDISLLHGLITGLLVSGSSLQAENYLRSLLLNKTGPENHQSTQALFSILTITQAWLTNFGFDFQMLLPHDDEDLPIRVEGFSDWAQGFIEGFFMSGITMDDIESEDTIEALQHFEEFSQMGLDDLEFGEEDEKAFAELVEYARLAVMQIFCDLNDDETGFSEPLQH